MSIKYIIDEVASLVERFHSRNPLELIQNSGILLRKIPLGHEDSSCKGFFLMYRRQKHITINADLPDSLQKVILAHELGHALLHSHKAGNSYHDIELFPLVSKDEYEANLFAAELLIPDRELLDAAEHSLSCEQFAASLGFPIGLIDFKLQILRYKGFESIPLYATESTFLKDLRGAYENKEYF